jgi:hypothetical protein
LKRIALASILIAAVLISSVFPYVNAAQQSYIQVGVDLRRYGSGTHTIGLPTNVGNALFAAVDFTGALIPSSSGNIWLGLFADSYQTIPLKSSSDQMTLYVRLQFLGAQSGVFNVTLSIGGSSPFANNTLKVIPVKATVPPPPAPSAVYIYAAIFLMVGVLIAVIGMKRKVVYR